MVNVKHKALGENEDNIYINILLKQLS